MQPECINYTPIVSTLKTIAAVILQQEIKRRIVWLIGVFSGKSLNNVVKS
jgi:hypothetical protein